MLIKQLLHEAFAEDDINLQALIMFLVFEKQVMTMEDDQSELNLYFLPKHEKRMCEELTKYKRKMNMKDQFYYKVFTEQKETLYILANSNTQAVAFASSLNYKPIESRMTPNQLMHIKHQDRLLSDVAKDKKVPCLLGQNDIEMKYNWRNLP